MKDLTHYFQSPNKVVNTNSSSLEDRVAIEKSPSPDLNGLGSLGFEESRRNENNECGNLENGMCEPEDCQRLVEKNSSVARIKRKYPKASGKASVDNEISDCGEGENTNQIKENLRKASKKKCAENGDVTSDKPCKSREPENCLVDTPVSPNTFQEEKCLENGDIASDKSCKAREPEDCPGDTPVSPNAFQVLMSTQQVFSSTNSGRKNSPQDTSENGQLKRENKKKIKENLEQMAKRKLEMEANIKACEKTVEKSTRKRKRVIVEADSENEVTSMPGNCSGATSDQALEKKSRKQRKSGVKVDIRRKQKNCKVSDEISELVIGESKVVESQELNYKNKNDLKYRETVVRKPKNMTVNVCNENDASKKNYGSQHSSETKVEVVSEILNISDNEKCSDSELSAVIVNANDLSDLPDVTKKKGNILNYFNKVTSDVKRQHTEKIKVTADVHFPVVSDVKVSRKVVVKRRSRKKRPNEDDIQLIDTEIIEKQNLQDSETNKSSVALSESRLPCATNPPVQVDSECKVTPSLAHKNWKIRIQIKESPSAGHKKCNSSIKKRKLKLSSGKQKSSETSPKVRFKEMTEVLSFNNNPRSEENEKTGVGKKLQTLREPSPSSSLQRKKTLLLAKSSVVKSESFSSREDAVDEHEDITDKNDPLLRRKKQVLDNQCTESKNSRLEWDAVLNKKRSTGVKISTPKGRKKNVTEKVSTPTLESEYTVRKKSLLKKCSEGNQPLQEKNTVKSTLKRKRSFLSQESPPPKKSGAKRSPLKKTMKNKSPAKDIVKIESDTYEEYVESDECLLEEEESYDSTSLKGNDDCVKKDSISYKKNIGKDCHSKEKKELSSTQEKNVSTKEKDETLTIGRSKRSCTMKNTTYTEEDINPLKKSKGETRTCGRKRSVSARTLQAEGMVFQSSKMFESLSSSTGRRSSPRKKSVSLITDYETSDDEEDFDSDSDDDFFGDSDDDFFGDSDDDFFGDSDDYYDSDENFNNNEQRKSVNSIFDMKVKKNCKGRKVTSKRKCVSRKGKEAKSIPISKKELEAAFRKKIALSKLQRAHTKTKMLDQEVVLQFIKKAKGTLNRKMALHDPENFSYKQSNDAGKKSVPIKLAPVFVSQKTKKPDKATMLARKTFLQSGVPEVVKKMVEVQKLAEEQEHVEFPSISHVQQKEDSALIWNLTDALEKFPDSPEKSSLTHLKVSKGDFTKCFEDSPSTIPYSASHPSKILLFRDFLRCIKAESPDFPVYRTFRSLLEVNRHQQLDDIKDNAAKKGKRKSSLAKKKEKANAAQDSEQRCAAWTSKYQPLSSDKILGNGYNISRFKKWLELWVQVKENTFQKKFKEDVSSGDEFLNDASDDESGRTVLPKKSVVLVGPTGSGKTMTVYALAQELGYKVLEVNAASKRTGRRILSELLEATQSHQVQGKGDETGSGIKGFFTSKGSSEKTNHPKKETEQTSKLSLILVDDVDVVFEEEDDGFVSALSTLVIGSKRPVVLVTSDSSCPHLPRFKENSLVLEFRHPPSKMISVWMQLVALLEGVRVRKSCVEELLRFNKGDVRKTLLQLQFWVLSGGNNSKALPELSPEADALQDFPDDVSNSSWVSLDDKKIENKTKHHLHSQCLDSFLELDEQILQIDRGKIWWNIPKLAGLEQVSHRVKTSDKSDNKCKNEINSLVPIEKASLGSESAVKGNNEEPKKWRNVCSADHMRVLMQLTDTLSMVQELSTATDCVANEPYQCAWEKNPLDSLSLSQDMRPCAYGTKLTAQSIGNWLVSASVNQSAMLLCPERHLPLANVIQQQPPQEEMSWREQQHNACREFEDAISMLYWSQRRAVTMDYMSCLRTISRLENDRVSVNDKRNNRFFHYLKGLGAHPSPAALDTACNTFDILNHL